VIASLLIFAASLFAVFFHIVPWMPEPTLLMSVTATEQVAEGDTALVRFIVWNVSDQPVKQVLLALNRTYLSKFILQSMDPKPAVLVPTAGARFYYYGPLQPGQDLRIEISLLARRPGTHRLKAQLYSEHGLQRREEAITTILP